MTAPRPAPQESLGDLAELPTVTFGHRSLMWWGTLGFMVIEGWTLALIVAMYFYVRQNFLNWASMLVSRAFLEAAGPMREDYFLYCEEVEWGLRGQKAGMRFGFAPEGVVVHKQGTSTGSATDLRDRSRLSVYLNERNRVLLSRDCYPALFAVTAITTLATLLIRFGKRRAWRQVGYGVQGWLAGLANRRGVPGWAQAA